MSRQLLRILLVLTVALAALPVSVAQPPRAAQAASGSWTQTQWNGNCGVTDVRPSGTTDFAEAYGLCAGPGPWCDGATELRLSGNHKTDGGNVR